MTKGPEIKARNKRAINRLFKIAHRQGLDDYEELSQVVSIRAGRLRDWFNSKGCHSIDDVRDAIRILEEREKRTGPVQKAEVAPPGRVNGGTTAVQTVRAIIHHASADELSEIAKAANDALIDRLGVK